MGNELNLETTQNCAESDLWLAEYVPEPLELLPSELPLGALRWYEARTYKASPDPFCWLGESRNM
jgi:hypothetical protein